MSIRFLSIAWWRSRALFQLLRAASVLLIAGLATAAASQAHAETRTLKLYFIHTKERADITYKKNGRYIQSGLNEVNRFLRDWRRNEPTKMDPKLLDIVWEAYQSVGARDYIHVVSAYRSPATNSMLRSRSKGVAKSSQHTLGKAMDFYIPGVKLSTLRAAGLKMGGGGVGYYPGSGSPFVHFDVGNVRHWPRMSRKELVAIFPDGKTMHVPTDGKPLPGYDQALASYKSRGRSGATVQVASNDSQPTKSRSGRGFLATLFSGGVDEEEESNASFEAFARATGRNVPTTASARSQAANEQLPGVAASAPTAAPAPAPEPQRVEETPEQIIAALPARSVPLPVFAERAADEVATLVASASATIPAGVPALEEQAVAAAVPVPVSRPSLDPSVGAGEAASAPATDAADAAQIRSSALASLADTVEATPTGRPADGRTGDGTALVAFAPVPPMRPSGDPIEEMIAAMPSTRPGTKAARGAMESDIVGAVQRKLGKASRITSEGNAASQRAVLLASTGKIDPMAAIASEVKTTEKSAKPEPQGAKAEPIPVVIPVEDVTARWALEHSGRLTRAIASSREPSFAKNAIRSSPRQAYTVGFVQVVREPDPARFARFDGPAIAFPPIATFDSN